MRFALCLLHPLRTGPMDQLLTRSAHPETRTPGLGPPVVGTALSVRCGDFEDEWNKQRGTGSVRATPGVYAVMDLEKPSAQPQQQATPEGCLAVAIRIPVRIVVLVLVVPVRMVWDALVVVGRVLR